MKKVYIAIDNKCDKEIMQAIIDMGFGIKFGHPMIGHIINGWMSDYISQMDVFLDLKFFDITSVVVKGINFYKSILKPKVITVHALGGHSYLSDIVQNAQDDQCNIVAVTVLTSVPDSRHTLSLVQQLATDAKEAGIQYVVCSYSEIDAIHEIGLKSIVPGIRRVTRDGKNKAGIKNDDQSRIVSPELALSKSDVCIIGRHVTEANQPVEEMRKIFNIINNTINEL